MNALRRQARGGNAGAGLAPGHRLLRALWEDARDFGDPATLAALVGKAGLDPVALPALGAEPRWAERRAADTEAALARGVFGTPSCAPGDEVFWGQDPPPCP